MVTTAPQRIQRKRTKGWRMPEGAVYVGRPSRWGNPFAVEWVRYFDEWWVVRDDETLSSWSAGDPFAGERAARVDAVRCFAGALRDGHLPVTAADVRGDLAGRDLACWCPLDQPCHADVLLELANAADAPPARP